MPDRDDDDVGSAAHPGRTGAESEAAALARGRRERARYLASVVGAAILPAASLGALGGVDEDHAPAVLLVAIAAVALVVAVGAGVVAAWPGARAFWGAAAGSFFAVLCVGSICVPLAQIGDGARFAPALALGVVVAAPVALRWSRAPSWIGGAAVVCALFLWAAVAEHEPPIAEHRAPDGSTVVEVRWRTRQSPGPMIVVRPAGPSALVARPVVRCSRPGFVDHEGRRRPFFPTRFAFGEGTVVAHDDADPRASVTIRLADGRTTCTGFGCGTQCATEGDALHVPLKTR